MTKRKIQHWTVVREKEAIRAELERLRLIGKIEVVAELLSLGLQPDRAFKVVGLDPAELGRRAAYDPAIALAMNKLKDAREEGIQSTLAVCRALYNRAQRNWQAARYFYEEFLRIP